MRAVFGTSKSDCIDPLVNQPSILSRAEVASVIDSGGESVVMNRAAATFEPGKKAGPNVSCQFELDGFPVFC